MILGMPQLRTRLYGRSSCTAVLWLHLLPALLAAPLVYELVHLTMPLLQRHLSNERARVVAVSALAVLVVGLVTAAVTWLVVYLRGEGHLTRLRRSAC